MAPNKPIAFTFIAQSGADTREERARRIRLAKIHAAKNARRRHVEAKRDDTDFRAAGPVVRFVAPPKCLSPTFGGVVVEVFDPANPSPIVLETVKYCLTTYWPPVVSAEESQEWLSWLSTYPSIFHGWAFETVLARGTLSSRKTHRTQALMHESQLIRHVSEMLKQWDAKSNDQDWMEALLLSVMMLQAHDLTSERLWVEDEPVATVPQTRASFRPLLPSLTWINDSAHTRSRKALNVKQTRHEQAIISIIMRLGGFGNIRNTGIVTAMASMDVIRASQLIERPMLPSCWTKHSPSASVLEEYGLECPTTLGAGFLHLPLNEATMAIMLEICNVNLLMDRLNHLVLSHSRMDVIRRLRTDAQHRLLSLPSWNELNAEEREHCPLTVYECCRIAALTYTLGVTCPLPNEDGWYRKPTDMLRTILKSDTAVAKDDALPLVLWSVFIGGIAAPEDDGTFSQMARKLLRAAGLVDWAEVQRILERFLWSYSACHAGAARFWKEIGVAEECSVEDVLLCKAGDEENGFSNVPDPSSATTTRLKECIKDT